MTFNFHLHFPSTEMLCIYKTHQGEWVFMTMKLLMFREDFIWRWRIGLLIKKEFQSSTGAKLWTFRFDFQRLQIKVVFYVEKSSENDLSWQSCIGYWFVELFVRSICSFCSLISKYCEMKFSCDRSCHDVDGTLGAVVCSRTIYNKFKSIKMTT